MGYLRLALFLVNCCGGADSRKAYLCNDCFKAVDAVDVEAVGHAFQYV